MAKLSKRNQYAPYQHRRSLLGLQTLFVASSSQSREESFGLIGDLLLIFWLLDNPGRSSYISGFAARYQSHRLSLPVALEHGGAKLFSINFGQMFFNPRDKLISGTCECLNVHKSLSSWSVIGFHHIPLLCLVSSRRRLSSFQDSSARRTASSRRVTRNWLCVSSFKEFTEASLSIRGKNSSAAPASCLIKSTGRKSLLAVSFWWSRST